MVLVLLFLIYGGSFRKCDVITCVPKIHMKNGNECPLEKCASEPDTRCCSATRHKSNERVASWTWLERRTLSPFARAFFAASVVSNRTYSWMAAAAETEVARPMRTLSSSKYVFMACVHKLSKWRANAFAEGAPFQRLWALWWVRHPKKRGLPFRLRPCANK